jgi:hypothetical protein
MLPSRQVGDVDERVIEGGVDVGHAENFLTLSDLRTQRNLDLFNLFLLSLARSHVSTFKTL